MASIGTIKERASTRATFASGKANRDETDCATKADPLKQLTPPRIPITLPSPRERGLVYPSLEQGSDGSISASVSVNVSADIVDMDKGFQDANGTRHPLDALVLIGNT
ncbi:hypothetical protein KEM55_006473, partial [Ascosphaera atra]